jgi:phosphoglycolate phosphatase
MPAASAASYARRLSVMTQKLDTILFDLDGTLADTAPDLALTLNLLLQEHDKPALPFALIRPHVSHGATALVKLGFGIDERAAAFEDLRQRFLDLYADNLCRETVLFPGMAELLDQLGQQSLRWGVVTNKPARFTEPLLQQLGIAARSACIISGDSTVKRKPDPEQMHLACKRLGISPAQCLYVGDAERDVTAGRAAGMQTLVATFGYLGEHDDPHAWQAHGIISTPGAILDWLHGYNGQSAISTN